MRTFLQQLPSDPFVRDRATIELVAWDTPGGGAPMLAARTPQASIDAGMPRPSECDVVIAVFWGRIGTPLPHPEYARADGTAYDRARCGSSRMPSTCRGHPAVRTSSSTAACPRGRSSSPSPTPTSDTRSTDGVEAYFGTFADPATGIISTAFSIYEKPDDFRQRIESDLRTLVKEVLDGDTAEPLPRTDAAPSSPLEGLAVPRPPFVHAG